MAEFGSVSFYQEMATMLRDDPTWQERGRSVDASFIFGYDAPVSQRILVNFEGGVVTDVHEAAPAEVADFAIEGTPETWRGIFDKSINPTIALTRGHLRTTGKVTGLLKNMKAFSYVIDSMSRIEIS